MTEPSSPEREQIKTLLKRGLYWEALGLPPGSPFKDIAKRVAELQLAFKDDPEILALLVRARQELKSPDYGAARSIWDPLMGKLTEEVARPVLGLDGEQEILLDRIWPENIGPCLRQGNGPAADEIRSKLTRKFRSAAVDLCNQAQDRWLKQGLDLRVAIMAVDKGVFCLELARGYAADVAAIDRLLSTARDISESFKRDARSRGIPIPTWPQRQAQPQPLPAKERPRPTPTRESKPRPTVPAPKPKPAVAASKPRVRAKRAKRKAVDRGRGFRFPRRLRVPVALIGMLAIAAAILIPRAIPSSGGEYVLRTSVDPVGSGLVAPSEGSYGDSERLLVEAVPAPGFRFDHWEGDAAGTANPARVTMDADKIAVACFEPLPAATVQDNFDSAASGWPTLAEENSQWQCGYTLAGAGSEYYIQLNENGPTAFVPNSMLGEHRDFSVSIDGRLETQGTNGSFGLISRLSSSSPSGYLFMISTAGYYMVEKLLDGSSSALVPWTESPFIRTGSGQVNRLMVECLGSEIKVFVNGQPLTALSDGDCESGTVGLVATASADAALRYGFDNFLLSPLEGAYPVAARYSLSTEVVPLGAASIAPRGGVYGEGEQVTVAVEPLSHYVFDHWSGDASGNANPMTITMDCDKSITAHMTRVQHTLTVDVSPLGAGATSTKLASYDAGAVVNVIASPYPGYRFDHWGGDGSGTGNPVSLTMDSDKRLTAYFVPVPTPTPTSEPTAAPAPDLGVTAIVWSPVTPSMGNTVTFTVTVKNTGNGQASSCTVGYYVDSQYLEQDYVSPLAPGATTNTTFTWQAQPGTHKVTAEIDDGDSIDESNENNNSKRVTVEVRPAPDLVVGNLGWSPGLPYYSPDMEIVFIVQVKNQGQGDAGASTLRLNVDGYSLGFASVPALPPGGMSEHHFVWIAKVGDRSIEVLVDQYNDVTESDESNNSLKVVLKVVSF